MKTECEHVFWNIDNKINCHFCGCEKPRYEIEKEIEEEYWASGFGLLDKYEASSFGRVRNKTTKRVLSESICKNYGYKNVSITLSSGKNKSMRVHRVVALIFKIVSGSEFVNHINGIKLDNSIKNLEKSNNKENMAHARRNGLVVYNTGSRNAFTKLTKEQAIEMILAYSKGEENKSIAKRFGITRVTVTNIIYGKHWPELNDFKKSIGLKLKHQEKMRKYHEKISSIPVMDGEHQKSVEVGENGTNN